MTGNKEADVIDLSLIAKQLWTKRKVFYKKIWPITFVVSCLFIICIPRGYTSEAKLAPEIDNSMSGGTIGSLASSFGIDLSQTQGGDAISPLLYPDLMEDNGFIASLLTIRVKDLEGGIDTDYYTYLKDYQKRAWWSSVILWVNSLFPKEENLGSNYQDNNPYFLTKRDDAIMEKARASIVLSVDKKTGVIGISAKAQDRLIAKILADSVTQHLQVFITNYRTNKARIDVEHYTLLSEEAREDYEKAVQIYSKYADTNFNPILQSVKERMNVLENDVSLKLNTYNTIMAQLDAAKGKVQERTPAFTILKGASVPIKASSPKRMLFVIGMLFLVTFIFVIYYSRDIIRQSFS